MWRRLLSSAHFQTLIREKKTPSWTWTWTWTWTSSPFQKTPPLFSHQQQQPASPPPPNSAIGETRVEDVMPIATGHEKEELEAHLQGKDLLEINHPVGPFGTKESPAIVKSVYDKRIVGCPGGEGEDEHDVVWFWLEKGNPFVCPVCSQYFMLEVVGTGGPPDGQWHDNHH